MATTVAVNLLLEKLNRVIIDKELNNPSLRTQIEIVKEKLEKVRKKLLKESNQTVNVSNLDKLLPSLYSAEYTIDLFITKLSLKRQKFPSRLRFHLLMFTHSQTLVHDMKELVGKINELCPEESSPEKKDDNAKCISKAIPGDDQPAQQPEPDLSAQLIESNQKLMDAPKSADSTESNPAEPTSRADQPLVNANKPSQLPEQPAAEPTSRADQSLVDADKLSQLPDEQPEAEPSKPEATPSSTAVQRHDKDPLKLSLPAEKPVADSSISGNPERPVAENQVHLQSSAVISDDEMDFVGRKKETDELEQAMLILQKLQFAIIVVGAAGSGKTSFVRNLYNRADMMQNFSLRAWVNASEEFSEAFPTEDIDQKAKNLLIDILKQVTTIKDEERLPREQVEAKFHEIFIRKRFLIVLDDVKNHALWQTLKGAFPNSLNGSRVIIITRNEAISREMTEPVTSVIQLQKLNIDESWALFLKKTHKTEESLRDWDINSSFKKQIWEKCNGLPLAIVVLAGLFSFKDPKIWSIEIAKVNFGEDPSNALLALAYEDLQPDLKPCLLYLGLFPKEYAIPARRLYRLWAAEGFAKPTLGKTPEDVVESYLEELIRRNMIDVAKWRLDGSPKRCRVPGVLYDNVFPNALEIGFFHVLKPSKHEGTSDIRRVAAYVDTSNYCPEKIRSYISFNTRKGDTPADEIERFIHKNIGNKSFGLLSLLDLEGVYKPILPEAIGNLILLNYLGLRWTFLDSIPNSIGDLPSLETLDVKHTNILSLPISIWNSKKLRHLYLNEIYLNVSLQKQLASGSLANLKTLWGLIIGKKSPSNDWLGRLKGLWKLGVTCHRGSLGQITAWISKSTNLKSLKLRSIDDFSRPAELTLEPMNNHSLLSELYLLGKLSQGGIEKLQLPKDNLKMLTLSVSELKEDPMPVLGKLPKLKILRLFARSYLGKEMICKAEEFPELRVLKLWMLEELENWSIEKGSMPCLREMELRCCEKLKLSKETDGWMKLRTLKEVTLTNMPREFVAQVQRNMEKENKVNIVKVNEWSFAPLPN